MVPDKHNIEGEIIADTIIINKKEDIPKLTGDAVGGCSDGYHTFDELYDYRMLYNAMWVNEGNVVATKSKKHSDGLDCFDGTWFVVTVELPEHGQVSNHYKLDHWDLFKIPEVKKAPVWDGHDPEIALARMKAYTRLLRV